jgi:hypothetical protein
MDQRKAGKTGAIATPLVDATVSLLDEFANRDKSPVTQQFLQQATRSKARENDEKKGDCGVNLFTPTSVYDAMKDKKPFINMSVRFFIHVAAIATIRDAILCIGRPAARCRRVFRRLPRESR